MKLRLYHYWRSTSSWRVRWGFALKGLPCEFVPVSLLDDSTDRPEHRSRHPRGYVPVLEFVDEKDPKRRYLTESLAILEWANELKPSPALFPADPYLRARTRALAEVINSGTHPLQNPPVQEAHSSDPAQKKAWAQRWIREGLEAYETFLADTAGRYSVGDSLTLADLCLAPQCYNAERFEVSLAAFPTIQRVLAALQAMPEYRESHPDRFKPDDAK